MEPLAATFASCSSESWPSRFWSTTRADSGAMCTTSVIDLMPMRVRPSTVAFFMMGTSLDRPQLDSTMPTW